MSRRWHAVESAMQGRIMVYVTQTPFRRQEPWATCTSGQPAKPPIRAEHLSTEHTYHAHLLHTHGAELVARLDALVDALPKDKPAEEPPSERVARAVRVDDLRVGKCMDGVHLRAVDIVARDYCCRLRAVCEDDRARAGRVRLGLGRDRAPDGREVRLVWEAVRAGPGLGLSLVADDDVDVGYDLLELQGEELGDEWRGKVEDEYLRRRRVSWGDSSMHVEQCDTPFPPRTPSSRPRAQTRCHA